MGDGAIDPDLEAPLPRGVRTLLALLRAAAEKNEPVVPLPVAPKPPGPTGRSKGVRALYRRAMSTWRTAADLVALLNERWGVPVSGLGGGSCSGGLPIDGPSPCRIWASEAPARRKRAWASVFCAAKGLNSALRLSHSEAGTGEELWSKLRKAASDIYGRTPGREAYRPFVSANVKERQTGSTRDRRVETLAA